MECPAVTYLPSLTRTSAGPVVQVLSLTQGCRVPGITQRQLYDHNLHNLQKIEMMHCQLGILRRTASTTWRFCSTST